MASCSEILAGKSSWPELVGTRGEDAALVIESENEFVKAEIINQRTPIKEIFICKRVLVVVNDDGFVTRVPTIG